MVSGTVTDRSAVWFRFTVTSSERPSSRSASAAPYDTRSSFSDRTSAAFDHSPVPVAFTAATRTCVAAAFTAVSVAQIPSAQPA